MPLLSRNAKPLLGQVKNRPYGGSDDNEPDLPPKRMRMTRQSQLPTPASSGSSRRSTDIANARSKEEEEAALRASPIDTSSDAEQEEQSNFKKHASAVARLDGADDPKPFKSLGRSELSLPKLAEPTTFKRLSAVPSPLARAGSKRSAGQDSEQPGSDDSDADVFGSSQSKRQKVGYGGSMFTKPKAKATKAGYGKSMERKRSEDKVKEERAAIRVREKQAEEEARRKAAEPTFKKHDDIPALRPDKDAAKIAFKTTAKRRDRTDSDPQCEDGADNSSELSDLPSDFERDGLNLPAGLELTDAEKELQSKAASYTPREPQCTICEATISTSVKEDFEDNFPKAKSWTFKWQQRFCNYHQKATAEKTWEECGYPAIDWEKLPERLKEERHMQSVQQMLSGEASGGESAFRKQLAEKVKGGRNKTLMQLEESERGGKEGKAGGSGAGYYGPRGEKVMTDHILTLFCSELRKQASRDRLIATSGVSGGVAGFVQAVLVPELAVSLIREDLGTKSEKDAVEVLAESAEVGELLHPEVEDRVVRRKEDEEMLDD